MRAYLIAAATAAAVAVLVVTLRPDDAPQETGPPAAAPEVASPPPAAGPSPSAADPDGHQEDYDAPVEQLIGHADHLDFERLSPAKRAALEAELSRRSDVRGVLWATYGPSLTGRPAPVEMPSALAELELPEFLYVLLSVRAQRLAVAAGTDLNLGKALQQSGTDHPSVKVVVTRSKRGGCMTVRADSDPFDRVFSAVPTASAAGPLAERLTRDVRVSGGKGVPPCTGQPPAFSAGGLQAVEALDVAAPPPG